MKKYLLAALALCYIACASPQSHTDHDHDAHAHDAHDHDAHASHDHDAHASHDHDAHAHDAHDHDHDDHDGQEHSDEIVFTAQQAAMGEFALEKVARSAFAPVIKTSGQIVSSPVDYQVVVAPAAGQVQWEKQVAPGAYLAQGVPVARIVSKNLAEGDTYARVKAEYEYALAQWERAEKLIADRIVTRSEYQQAKRDYENARQAYQALQGAADQRGIVVRAPWAGYVRSVDVAPGVYAEKGGALLSMVRASRGRLQVDVPQKYYARLPEVSSAVFVAQAGKAYDTDSLNGRVVSFSRSVSPSGLLSLTMDYDSPADIPQGAFVQVSLRLKDKKDAITVPLSALTEEQGLYFVYVQLDEQGYQKRPVTVGQDDGLRAEILSGLHEGETVVSKGAYRVKLASASGAIPHSHEH